jgi:hypothetical protein
MNSRFSRLHTEECGAESKMRCLRAGFLQQATLLYSDKYESASTRDREINRGSFAADTFLLTYH